MYSAGNASAVGVDSIAAAGVADDVSRETIVGAGGESVGASVGAAVGAAVGTDVTGGAVGQSIADVAPADQAVIVAAAHCKPAR